MSAVPIWVLNRASRNAVAAAKKNAATHPSLPMPDSAHSYTSRLGASPKQMTSESESYSAPKALWVLVIRAMRPSAPSSTIATKIAAAAASNRPSIPAMTA